MLKSLRLRPILVSVLLLACTREAVCDDLVTTYESLFNDHVDITVPGYSSGSNIISNFPLLVRLSESNPSGFKYSRVDAHGADLRFLYHYVTNDVEAVAEVPYEVDEWHVGGESFVWVRLPVLNNNTKKMRLTMYWAPDEPSALPVNDSRRTWDDFIGVWHLRDNTDSSPNGLSSSLGPVARSSVGILGAAYGTDSPGAHGPVLSVPHSPVLDELSGGYTVLAWVRLASLTNAYLYSRREDAATAAMAAQFEESGTALKLRLWNNDTSSLITSSTLSTNAWVHVAVVGTGNGQHRVYLNGASALDSSALKPDTPGTLGLAIGGLLGQSDAGTLDGEIDEFRMIRGPMLPRWVKQDCEQTSKAGYIAFGEVSSTGKPVYSGKDPHDDPSPGTGEGVSPADYAGTATFVPAGLGSGVALTNFVTLIKVWENEPAGFVPRDLPFGTEDLRFFDEQGNVLNFEIDLWDVNGESCFWVRIPQLTASSRVIMCWGLREGRVLPVNDPTAVWSEYAGVWHMTDEGDSTANGATGAFGPAAVQMYGLVGKAAGAQVSGQNGAILDVEANAAIDSLTNDTFTVSGWVILNQPNVNHGALFSRSTATDPAWGAQFCGGASGDSTRLAMETGSSRVQMDTSEVDWLDWVRFDCVYAKNSLTFYVNGEKTGESVGAQTVRNGSGGKLSIGGFVSAAEETLGLYTLRGFVDEFRLLPGVQSVTEIATDVGQCTEDDFYDRQPVVWDDTAVLQNRWRVYPSASKTSWNEGDEPAEFTLGEPWYGVSTLSFQNRTTGEVFLEMPTVGGDYRAVFSVPQDGRYSALTYTIDFRIRIYRPTHDLGVENDRILLLNGDQSIPDGKVYVQAYSDTAVIPGRPYWVHDVDSGYDYTSTSPYYNFCGGLRHTYYARGDGAERKRLWDLIDVRYGNTYNNADYVFTQTGDWEEWEDGLRPDMNYLSWNPQGGCLVEDSGLVAEGWHEYAAQAVMCNTLRASINSTLYTNGIGTIYFDVVNSHTDDATNGHYRIVVEMATNAVNRSTGRPEGVPTDEAIVSTMDDYAVVVDPYKFADWKRLTMNVRLVNGDTMTELEPTNELTLALAGGGSYTNFYRVYIPVDYLNAARFRIRRTAVNPDYTLAPDVRSLVLVDNVICSLPTARVAIEPRGFYDETKVKRETVGYEGAILPSYPSVSDPEIHARARARTRYGEKPGAGVLSSVLMHYRWRYLNQQSTDWTTADLDPTTLTSVDPLVWPVLSGDLEYWYEVNQSDAFYRYADYSGLSLGLPGYSEEVQSVTNRAPTYATDGRDWFTRIRDGKSTYGTIKLFVRRGESAPVESVEMFVARDRIWRGCLVATNAVPGGVLFRFEGRNHQDDTLEDFQFNTNYWHLADTAANLPFSGTVVAGEAGDWGRVPCDGATGYLMFQLDETSRALTVVHADWQDFNAWNDANKDYFKGASVDDSMKSGTSLSRREYLCYASQWTDDVATNIFWTESFSPTGISGYEFYAPFENETSPNGFTVGYGMWVPSAYSLVEKTKAGHYEQALQMRGQGQGFAQMTNPTVKPRGLESIKFNTRIAQSVSPDDFAYFYGADLSNCTFLTRAAFDLNANSNFTGNASLSLAAFYRPRTGCYEARWEQLDGHIEDGSGTILGPKARGQRLAIYRWNYDGEWRSTALYAATNSDAVCSWKSNLAPQAIPQAHSITNGLMPFYIGAYDSGSAGTLVIAAVHIKGVAAASENVKGNRADATVNALMNERGWLYVVYRDSSPNRLKYGTYGVLSANCEGVFVRPQYHNGIVSWENAANTKTLGTKVWPTAGNDGALAQFYNYASVRECVKDFAAGKWIVPSGRMESFYATASESDPYNGFRACEVTQTVDVYTAKIGTADWSSTPVTNCQVRGFGKPGILQDTVINLWSTDDSSVRLRAGGKYDTGVRTDVVIDNILISQWRGDDWFGNTAAERSQYGLTNFVYTSGWINDGALQLSPRRTPDHYPCSLRVPLCDGGGSGRNKRGLGLGSLSIKYRNAQANARLVFQIATNGVTSLNLREYTLDPGEDDTYWTTVTNFDFSAMTPAQRASGVIGCSLGFHGVAGTMRVIVDPTLRAEVKDGTDPDLFGSVEIVEAEFRDEPALDKGCWWGFNIRTVGGANDPTDEEKKMYLPDSPMRSADPTLEEIGMSLALNNSITADCDPAEVVKVPNPFREHRPFLQTPTFSSNVVGEISFKARKYNLQQGSKPAEVRLYGTQARDVDKVKDDEWKELNVFTISNTTYEVYRFKTDTSAGFRAFRLAVTGVDGVLSPGPDPKSGGEPVRVLLEDVLVSEAIRARLAFRNVGAFRHDIAKTTYVPNVPSAQEQPICGEGWGVQAEVYPAMLGEEIDPTVKPRVRLHYYKGVNPWGYSNWKTKGTSAWLTEATDTNNFYRSSALESSGSVIPMSDSFEVVQYMLEVVYSVINSETGNRSFATNWLESVDWPVPSWYSPVDYNASRGQGQADAFSAFSLIDEIAPGWAWINEINIFGMFTSSFDNTDKTRQFVEVAKPVESSLDGWSLRMLSAKNSRSLDSAVTTNEVAVFGLGVSAEKATPEAYNMSFVVVGNPESVTSLSRAKGEYDGGWTFKNLDSVFNRDGKNYYLAGWEPVAIQLVRPSGVIEHEVAVLGTNDWPVSSKWAHSSSNLVNILKNRDSKSTFFALPDDDAGQTKSVGVYDSRGEAAKWWNNTMKLTPGNVNERQVIDPDHPVPGGELILVFASVDRTFGRIVQTVGAGTNTTEMQTISVKSGSEAGLDIFYTVNPWCELGTVKETEGGKARVPVVSAGPGPRQYKVNVAKGASRNVTVLAAATVDSRLRAFGLDERNRYTPAVLHWLEGGKTLNGEFYGYSGGTTNDTIHLAKFLALSGAVTNDMTLTQMYWLDIDPTADEMYFRAGMVRPPSIEVVKRPTYDPAHDPKAYTNLRVGVYMSISNGNGRVSRDGSPVWAPYVLRGLGEGETSLDYDPAGDNPNVWTSVTFKVTGYLDNGLRSVTNAVAWIPLRYFVFNEESFDANFESSIDLVDPFSTTSPTYAEGWTEWVETHGGVQPPVYFSWNLDTRMKQITAEVLAPTNRLVNLP